MASLTTPLDLILGPDQARAFLHARAQELSQLDHLPGTVALRLVHRGALRGDPLVLAQERQTWTLRADTDPDDAPAHRLCVHARLTCPPRVLVTDPDDPMGETDELLIEVLEMYQLATWYPLPAIGDKSAPRLQPSGSTGTQDVPARRAELIAAGRCPNCQWLTYQCNCADHPDA
ncbi:hypothetical protein C9F11_27500 [Streptomyces sp. YIM 121038]|uniref:hypothetical protein n=1 Tax=Streptomyces sp. YIM 121038 TaxID=2136401 RepID=UPI001110802A|nr:hypothetical protein [Streptomyces sp. YIM 121038]QCX79102.1 hypothetical protein C9F11_27500 [Streptomyces sp. YIM 121038]